jgi:hypothetical protein
MAALAVFTSTINANLLFPTDGKWVRTVWLFVRTAGSVNVRLDPIINSEVPRRRNTYTVMGARFALALTMIPTSTNTKTTCNVVQDGMWYCTIRTLGAEAWRSTTHTHYYARR